MIMSKYVPKGLPDLEVHTDRRVCAGGLQNRRLYREREVSRIRTTNDPRLGDVLGAQQRHHDEVFPAVRV